MDIREYFQTKQKGFYAIIINSLTAARRKQLYDAINEWHEEEVKKLHLHGVSKCIEPVAMDTLIDHYATKLLSCYTKSGIIEQLKHLISKVN